MSQQRYTWKKDEKLKSRKRIERVFKEGRNFSVFPFKVFYLLAGPGVAVGGPVIAPVQSAASPLPMQSGPTPDQPGTVGHPDPAGHSPAMPLQAGFGAGTRHFKKAVDRNRIKRLSREAYLLQKQPLAGQLREKGLSMAVFFIYTGKELPPFELVSEKIGVALKKLMKETA